MHYLRLIESKKIAKRHVDLIRARDYWVRRNPIYREQFEQDYVNKERKSRKTKFLSSCCCSICTDHKRKNRKGFDKLTRQEKLFYGEKIEFQEVS
jgi:hypothetical protein